MREATRFQLSESLTLLRWSLKYDNSISSVRIVLCGLFGRIPTFVYIRFDIQNNIASTVFETVLRNLMKLRNLETILKLYN